MGIDYDSKLFVGAHRSEINCSSEFLGEMEDEEFIIRVSPHYDADSRYCYYGIEVSCDEVLGENGIALIKSYIEEMNTKFQTTKCTLQHSPHIW